MTLFDSSTLARAVEVQKRCYGFLQLIREDRLKLSAGWALGSFHGDGIDEAERLKELVLAHFEVLPETARPLSSSERGLDEFANFFVSYLICSFEIVDHPRLVHLSGPTTPDCCFCELCARLTRAPDLKLKKTTGRDKGVANSLEAEAVRRLVETENLAPAPEKIAAVLEDESLAAARALVAYGLELIRRCRGEDADASSLVLWRRFAWENNRPKKDFALSAALIERAARRLRGELKSPAESKV